MDQETQIRHYLLGILAPEQQQEVEESILTNDEQLSLVEMLEDELVDDYVQGLLSPSERTHFEQHFLCVEERRAKVRFARILSSYGKMQSAGSSVSSPARPSNQFIAAWRMLTPAWELSVVALVLGLIVAISWLAVSNNRLAANLRATRQGGDRSQTESLTAQLDSERRKSAALATELVRQHNENVTGSTPPATTSEILTATLAPGLMREGGHTNRLLLSPSVLIVSITLELPEHDYDYYRIQLQKASGEEIWTQSLVRRASKGKKIVVQLPSSLLAADDYQVRLSGLEPGAQPEHIATYSFRAVRTTEP